MFVRGILAAVLVGLASAYPGFLHDAPHYTHEVLQNIHNTPYCAYPCIFNDKYPMKFAPECNGKEGKAFGACLCRADAFQYMFDQCVAIRCEKGEAEDRKLAREMNWKSCKHYGVDKKDMYKLEELPDDE